MGQLEKCKQYLEYGYDTLQVFDRELERVEGFNGLNDFCSTFELQRGKEIDDDDDNSAVGEVKVSANDVTRSLVQNNLTKLFVDIFCFLM